MKRKLIGVDCTQPAGEATGETSTPQIKSADGDVIGISVSSNYADADNGKMYLTLEHGGNKYLDEVPVNQLLPANGFRYHELIPALDPGEVKLTVKSITANSAVANPLRVIFHHEKK